MNLHHRMRPHRSSATSILLLACCFIVFLALAPLTLRGQDAETSSTPSSSQSEQSVAAEHSTEEDHSTDGEHASAETHGGEGAHPQKIPSIFWITPFILILLAISILPLLPQTSHWWHKNQNKLIISIILSIVTIAYYYFRSFGFPHGEHLTETGLPTVLAVLDHAVLKDYIPFIVLLFSLYCISGGINLTGDIQATPRNNTVLIGIGTVLANFIGTTGSAMLLIRPLLQINRERTFKRHTVIFFIFLACNIGGCLLPIGDPPLFLGYLRGVPFLWTTNLWVEWLLMALIVLTIYFVWDNIVYRREPADAIKMDKSQLEPLRVKGGLNFLWLLGVVLAVALLVPNKPFLSLGKKDDQGRKLYTLESHGETQTAYEFEAQKDGDTKPAYATPLDSAHQVDLGATTPTDVDVKVDSETATVYEAQGGAEEAQPLRVFEHGGTQYRLLSESEMSHLTAQPQFFLVPPFMREVVMLILVAIGWYMTSPRLREANKFNFEAIGEVAALFIGIFITMQVPVEILNLKGEELGLHAPWHFFWATGMLSSFLDNAPTYVVFFETAKTLPIESGARAVQLIGGGQISYELLVAISIGAVFMGANTYIGNGPNFMVKSIAESTGVKMPSFFGYMIYSGLILIPCFVIITFIFLVH